MENPGPWNAVISRKELEEYLQGLSRRVRLFDSNQEMIGDGLLGYDGIFYISLDSRPDITYKIKSGDMLGIEIKGRLGFYPKRVVF